MLIHQNHAETAPVLTWCAAVSACFSVLAHGQHIYTTFIYHAQPHVNTQTRARPLSVCPHSGRAGMMLGMLPQLIVLERALCAGMSRVSA